MNLGAVLILAVLAFAFASPVTAQVEERRWEVRTSDGRIVGLTDDYSLAAPYGTGTIFVLESVIRAADPPGADGDILSQGTWIAGVYTAPTGVVIAFDPDTAIGGVQVACSNMLDTFEIALEYIHDNMLAWQHAAVRRAVEGIYWQTVNTARVALNTTRTHARRQKFCEESASWPTGLSGDVVEYVDAMGGDSVDLPTKDWSWVDPQADPYTRTNVGDAGQGFMSATNVENAPGSDALIGRGWIRAIP